MIDNHLNLVQHISNLGVSVVFADGTISCKGIYTNTDIGSTAAEVPVKFQSDRPILNVNLAASRLCATLR